MANYRTLLTLIAAGAALLTSCTSKVNKYVDWMYDNMPLEDSVSYQREYWTANVAKTLEVRKNMGWDIPELEFRYFVLPTRVNNETLDDFRTTYADTLCARVKGMSIEEAALEINHWCHEQATYRPSDSRTSSPMATIRKGYGRCGEESVLGVAALRAAGIPARQVYTPRWAHTDDNHAWVEVWIDGKWHFLGACEPEPKLDMAWFNGPVSRAMLLHTNVFGRYDGPEDVIKATPVSTEINVIRGYVPARLTTVEVRDTAGNTIEGAKVAFRIYNYAEFYEVARYSTNAKGQTSLNTGCGDLLVTASLGDRFGFAVAQGEFTTVTLDHSIGEQFSADVDIVPPVENPIPSSATAEEIVENNRRKAEEDAIRESHDHANHDLETFLAARPAHAEDLINCLSDKDLNDVTADVLWDALANSSSLDPDVLSPRVELEFLKPYRAEILESGIANRLHTAEEVALWIADSIKVDDSRSPRQMRIAPVDVWRSRKANSKSRDIFYVALCRTLGIPAHLDEVTGSIDSEIEREGVMISYTGDLTPKYYRNFTISSVKPESTHLLEFGSDADDTPLQALGSPVMLEKGYYLMTTGTRLADGSVLAHMEFFNTADGSVPMVIRKAENKLPVIGSFDAEPFIPQTGRGWFIIAVLGDKDEPSVHARNDIASISENIKAWGRPLVYSDEKTAETLCEACQQSPCILPVIAVSDTFGRIVYLSKGYNTSLAADLTRCMNELK